MINLKFKEQEISRLIRGKLAYIDLITTLSLLVSIDVQVVAHALVDRCVQALLHLLLKKIVELEKSILERPI